MIDWPPNPSNNPAVLKVKMKIKIKLPPQMRSEIGHKSYISVGNDSPDPPPDPPGEGGEKQN